MTLQIDALKRLLSDCVLFARHGSGVQLRSYQIAAAQAIADSVIHARGLHFVVAMSRQSGKNETQAQIEAYLLTLLSRRTTEMVKASPTFKPQTQNAMRRLQRTLEGNALTRNIWEHEEGYIYRVGLSRIYFLSGQPRSNVVGATASTLLECDEAQDVLIAKWDKDFAPMASSTNATIVFWGTVWTSTTLLAREIRIAKQDEVRDGIRRYFSADAETVGAEVPAYAMFVDQQVKRLGRQHPLIKTQYYLEEIDAEGGMFNSTRRNLMRGTHLRQTTPTEGKQYSLLIDVAGEDEDAEGAEVREREPRKDSTAITIVEVDLSTLSDDILRAPTYRVVDRLLFTGTKHTQLYGRILALADNWNARYLVVDATGIGAGLTSFLAGALPTRVLPYLFTSKSASDLGFGFLAVIDSGRFRDYVSGTDELREQFERECGACQYEILDGPAHQMRWSVPDGTRDPSTGELMHDDLLKSAALCWHLDSQIWPTGFASTVIQGRDPLEEIDRARRTGDR